MPTSETGPFLKAALFCESVIEGKDGVLSLIRVIDRLTITAAGPNVPKAMPTANYELNLVLMVVSGRARGSHTISLRVEPPVGTTTDVWSSTILLEGEDRGANLVAQISYAFESEGLYWFHLRLDDDHLATVPFRIIYQRVAPASPRQ